MTEPLGPDAHLGLDRIADLEEGLLSAAEEQSARAHLAGCDVCQSDLSALAAVHEALLGDAEIAMPDDVADRVYAALAELPALAPAVAAATTLPLRTGPSRWERSRKPVLASLAAAACIALLTLGIIHLPRSNESTASSAGVTGAAAAPAGPEILHSGHDYSAHSLGSDGAALVAPPAAAAATNKAAAAATSAAAAPASAAAAPTSAAAAAVTSAAATSAAAPVASAAGGTSAASGATSGGAAAAPTSAAAPAVPAPTTDALSQLRDPAAAQRCIALLVGSTTPPRVIDYATFAGKPAVIAVVDDPQDPTKLAVIAVGPPGCSLYSLNFVSKP